MKIDTQRTQLERLFAPHTQGADESTQKTNAAAGSRGRADQLTLSSRAQLASSAVNAAGESPDVRPEKIERARALIESGELGRDPYRLADALMSRALNENE